MLLRSPLVKAIWGLDDNEEWGALAGAPQVAVGAFQGKNGQRTSREKKQQGLHSARSIPPTRKWAPRSQPASMMPPH